MLLEHRSSLDARTAVEHRYKTADSHIIYSARWIMDDTDAYSPYRLGESEAASITLYFSRKSRNSRVFSNMPTLQPVGSSAAIFAPALLTDIASENPELPLVTYTIDRREDLCTIFKQLSHGMSSFIAMDECHVPSSLGQHVFHLGTRSPSLTFSHLHIYSFPSSSLTSLSSPHN